MSTDAKIDKIINDIGEIKVTLAVNTQSLVEHVRRTEIIESDMKPVKKHVQRVQGVLIFIGALAAVGAGVEGLIMCAKLLLKGIV